MCDEGRGDHAASSMAWGRGGNNNNRSTVIATVAPSTTKKHNPKLAKSAMSKEMQSYKQRALGAVCNSTAPDDH